MIKQKNDWIENDKDLANNNLFNILYFISFICSAIWGTRYHDAHGWGIGSFFAIYCFIAIYIQFIWQQKRIDYWMNKRKELEGK